MADNTNNLYFKIGLVTKGAYSATATYAVNDTVQASDGLYASRKSNNTGHPLSETEWWALIVDLSETKQATEAANEAAENAQNAADRAEELVENYEHGYLEGQRVGVADNIAPQGEGSEVEFTSRALTDVEKNSVAMFPKIMGRSLVWNQLWPQPLPAQAFGRYGATITKSGDVVHVDNTTATNNGAGVQIPNRSYKVGHKYAISITIKATAIGAGYLNINSATNLTCNLSECLNTWKTFYAIGDHPVDTDIDYIFEQSGKGAIFDFKDLKITDLTRLFEAGNEPTTYSEFLQRKPIVEDEYAYDEGTISSNNKVEKVASTGIQLWDEQWEVGSYNSQGEKSTATDRIRSKNPIRVIGGKAYYCYLGVTAPTAEAASFWYDENMNLISYDWAWKNGARTAPANAVYLNIAIYGGGATYGNNVCINLSEPSINGQYFPYEEHTLDLSWIKEIKDENGVALFEDGMRSAGSAYDEAGAKKATKRMEIEDLGNFNWYKSIQGGKVFFYSAPSSKIKGEEFAKANALCIGYTITSAQASQLLSDDKHLGIYSNGAVYIYDTAFADMSAEDVKTALQGKYLIYELTTPIEVEYPAQNLCVKQTTGGVMTVEAGTGQNTTPFRALLVNGLNAFGRLMAIGKTSELQTTAKTVVGAINEIYAMLTNAAAQSE